MRYDIFTCTNKTVHNILSGILCVLALIAGDGVALARAPHATVEVTWGNREGNVRYVSRGRRTLYAFLRNWDGKPLELPDLEADKIERISQVGGGGGELKWQNHGGKVIVETSRPTDDGVETVIEIKLKSDITALFIGDSITDGAWGRSAGNMVPSSKRNKTDQNHALGHSYVMLAAARVMAENPSLRCNWLNRGISGNTVDSLKERWTEDMICEDPDILTVMVGINDVCRHYSDGEETDFDVAAWTAKFRELLTEAREANPALRIVLMSPFVAEGRSVKKSIFPRVKKSIDMCALSVEELAKEFNAAYIDTNGLFNSLTSGNPDSARWLWDGIHPTPAGHQLIADRWIEMTCLLHLLGNLN